MHDREFLDGWGDEKLLCGPLWMLEKLLSVFLSGRLASFFYFYFGPAASVECHVPYRTSICSLNSAFLERTNKAVEGLGLCTVRYGTAYCSTGLLCT